MRSNVSSSRRSASSNAPPGCSDLAVLLSALLRDVDRVAIRGWESTALSYPEFVQYFEQTGPLARHHLIIGASLAYAWMPTILDFRSDCFDLGVDILERARAGKELSSQDLLELSKIVNNSIVGGAKLLHFVAPNRYSIWDSSLAAYLGARVKGGVAGAEQYQACNASCRSLAKKPEAENIAVKIGERIGCVLKPMRAIELLMFYGGLEKLTYRA